MRTPSRYARSLAFALALTALGPALSHAGGEKSTDGPRDAKRESLQEFLSRLRQHRDGIIEELRGGVEAILRQMDEAALSRDIPALDAARDRLVALGPECGPLLVEKIDPGSQATDAIRLRSMSVCEALAALGTRAITQRLIDMAQAGSIEGRVNAVELLGTSPEKERAGGVLVGIYRGSHGQLRVAALVGLAKLGGEASDKILAEALADAQPDIVKSALEALWRAHNVSMAGRVLKLAAVSSDAVRYLEPLLMYYRTVPEAVDKATLSALIRIAGEFTATVEDRTRVLELLPMFADRFDPESKRELRGISESPTKDLREAALVVLVLVGDKSARRELLDEYDEQIERNKGWANSYEARANVLYRIGDYREAINDYKQALKLSADDLRARQDQSYIGLARCHAQLGKYKDAAATLKKAPLTMKQIGELAHDPAFAKMADDPKWKDVFQLK